MRTLGSKMTRSWMIKLEASVLFDMDMCATHTVICSDMLECLGHYLSSISVLPLLRALHHIHTCFHDINMLHTLHLPVMNIHQSNTLHT
jgi:hypothetical protein